jgi:Outer membrane protein beta-barrel domain
MITTPGRRLDPHLPAPHRARRVLLVLAVLLLASTGEAVDWAVGVEGGYCDMTNASKSAKAIFDGSSGGGTIGGFLRFGFGRSFFVEGHGRYFQREGERVFVAAPGSPVFRLGHPLTIRLVPVYGMIGYRFGQWPRWAPYVTLGLGATSYKETSNVAGLVETASATKASGHGALGVDFLAGPVRFGVELGYSTVPNTIGESGVSKVYGEKDVGGLTVLARLAFGSRAN